MQRERERERAIERERQLEIATFVDNRHKYAKKQANILINEEEEEDNKAKEKRFEEMDQGRQALWKKLFPKISTIERLIVGMHTTLITRARCWSTAAFACSVRAFGSEANIWHQSRSGQRCFVTSPPL
jgi:uncharacterized membrane protein YcjF (UPF0283 family)